LFAHLKRVAEADCSVSAMPFAAIAPTKVSNLQGKIRRVGPTFGPILRLQ
jgi:hypothetical protein